MRATVMYRAGDVRVENVPDATIVDPTDAVIRVSRACICGSDLWPYKLMEPDNAGRRMGHEAIGKLRVRPFRETWLFFFDVPRKDLIERPGPRHKLRRIP